MLKYSRSFVQLFVFLRPYIILGRFHQPIGIYLLLWPCWWGLAYTAQSLPILTDLGLFVIGAAVMRGAGCTLNDWIDQDFDRHVERTKYRPLACGTLNSKQAFIFFIVQCALGSVILWQLPLRCWLISGIGFLLLLIYPLMKRLTDWPQVILGFAFNIGIWIGAATQLPFSQQDIFPLALLYLGGIFWTIGYDTIYALQDIADDLKIGVRSTAIRFGTAVIPMIHTFYALSFFCFFAHAFFVKASILCWMTLLITYSSILYQLWGLNPQNRERCHILFRQNMWVGIFIFIALCLASNFSSSSLSVRGII